jgi:hypothetical protein
VSTRSRIVVYGAAGLLVLAGGLCGGLVSGETGEILALVLCGIGLVALVGLVFMEVGLSEDRERERDRRRVESGAARRPHRPVRFKRRP